MIDLPIKSTRRPTNPGVSGAAPNFGSPKSARARRRGGETPVRVFGKETPHVQVFDAGAPIDVMQRATLTQRDGEESRRVQHCGFRLAREQIGAIRRGNVTEAPQVFQLDRNERASAQVP